MKKATIVLIVTLSIGLLLYAFGRQGISGQLAGRFADIYDPTDETFGFTTGDSLASATDGLCFGTILASPYTGYASSMSVSIVGTPAANSYAQFGICTADGSTLLGSTIKVPASTVTTASFTNGPLLNAGTNYMLLVQFTFDDGVQYNWIARSFNNIGVSSGTRWFSGFPTGSIELYEVTQGLAFAISCTVQIRDSQPPPDNPPPTVTIYPTLIIPSESFVGTSVSTTIQVSGGTAPYAYSLSLDGSVVYTSSMTTTIATYAFLGLTIGNHTASVYMEDSRGNIAASPIYTFRVIAQSETPPDSTPTPPSETNTENPPTDLSGILNEATTIGGAATAILSAIGIVLVNPEWFGKKKW